MQNNNQEPEIFVFTDEEGNDVTVQVLEYFYYNGKEYATVDLVASDAVRRSTWLFIVDTILGIFSSTIFKIVVGVILLAVLAFIIFGVLNRRKRRRRSRRIGGYQGRRRR